MKTMHSQPKSNFYFTEKVQALSKPKSRKLEGDKPFKIDQSEKVPNQSYTNAGSGVPRLYPCRITRTTLPPDSYNRAGIGIGRSLERSNRWPERIVLYTDQKNTK